MILTLDELKQFHLVEASRLLVNAGREIERTPMRVSTADVTRWRTLAAFHMDAAELIDRAKVWERLACDL